MQADQFWLQVNFLEKTVFENAFRVKKCALSEIFLAAYNWQGIPVFEFSTVVYRQLSVNI